MNVFYLGESFINKGGIWVESQKIRHLGLYGRKSFWRKEMANRNIEKVSEVDSKRTWYKWTYLQNRLRDLEKKFMTAVAGEGWEDVREFEMDMNTMLYLKWITNKVLLYITENSAQCYGAAWKGGNLGENGYMRIYGWVPLLSTGNYHNIVNRLYFNTK